MKKLWIPLVIVLVLAGTYLILGATYAARSKAARAAWKADGHPLTIEELEVEFDRGSESTAAVVRQAADMLQNKDRERLALLDSAGYASNPAAADSFLKEKARLYELVMQVSAMPPADFGTNVRDGIGARIFDRMPAVESFRNLLRLKAQALAAQGRPDSALKVLSASVALTGLFAEPMTFYDLVNSLNLDSTCAAAARIAPKAGTHAVDALIARLEQPDLKATQCHAVECEIAMTSYSIRDGSISRLSGAVKFAAALLKAFRPLRDYTEARTFELARQDLEVMPKPWSQGHAELARLDSTVKGKDPLNQVASIAMPMVGPFYSRSERAAAWREMSVLGLKLLQKRRQGALPTALPEDAPMDRFNGKPYGFQTVPDGFVVYSVGPDEKDDGADPAKDLVLKFTL